MAPGVTTAALSQPFTLGMLVDARKDRLTPGFMLWDKKTIQDITEVTPHHSSEVYISTSDSTESKTSLLDVNASLKASFLGGLVEVNGSAKYLKDQKKFTNQSRVTFQYKATTNFKQLSMAHLSTLDPQQMSVIEKGFATHMVTKILYGANAFFVFDSEKLDAGDVTHMEGSMEAVINKIPTFTAEGKVKIELTDEEKSLIQKFSCKFYGDFILESNPATFVDAVKSFATLPTLLGENGDKTVPVKVWLMPLKNFSPKAPDLLAELSIGLVRKVEDTLEDVKQMGTRCNDALVDGVGEDFPQIQEDLRRYQKLCNYYTSNLQQALETKLPSIRQGKEDESSLRQVFDSRATSPFSHEKLLKWLEGKEREINVIRSCLQIMEGVKIVRNQSELDREVLTPGVQHTLCFVFTSLETADPCLDAMAQYLDSLQPGCNCEEIPWFYSNEVLTRMRETARNLVDIAQNYKNNKWAKFLVAAIENESHTGAAFYHYKNGVMVSDDFTKPDVPPVETIKDKSEFMWYACDLTVDTDTVNDFLNVSGDLKKVRHNNNYRNQYPDNPKRFDNQPQFMCRERLTGRHYWEVKWSDDPWTLINIAVAYDAIERKGSGDLNKSDKAWGFVQVYGMFGQGLYVCHSGNRVKHFGFPPGCTRIGVYLDWHAGTLSFYRVSSDTLTHFYTFRTTFTEPLYPAFHLMTGGNYVQLLKTE